LADTWNKNLCDMNQAYMISRSLIFIITITILTGEKLNNCSNSNTCLPYYVIPVHYHIKLNHSENYDFYYKIEYSFFEFSGESSTTINILQSTKYIKLHALNLFIHQGKITLTKNNGVTYALKTYIETHETNILEFHFCNVLSPGIYTLKMEFFGQLAENFLKSSFKRFYTKKENSIMWVNI